MCWKSKSDSKHEGSGLVPMYAVTCWPEAGDPNFINTNPLSKAPIHTSLAPARKPCNTASARSPESSPQDPLCSRPREKFVHSARHAAELYRWPTRTNCRYRHEITDEHRGFENTSLFVGRAQGREKAECGMDGFKRTCGGLHVRGTSPHSTHGGNAIRAVKLFEPHCTCRRSATARALKSGFWLSRECRGSAGRLPKNGRNDSLRRANAVGRRFGAKRMQMGCQMGSFGVVVKRHAKCVPGARKCQGNKSSRLCGGPWHLAQSQDQRHIRPRPAPAPYRLTSLLCPSITVGLLRTLSSPVVLTAAAHPHTNRTLQRVSCLGAHIHHQHSA
jgi:hypothetical protein